MKVNLMVRGTVLNGFLNLDCAANPSENDRVFVDPYKLDDVLDHNEVDEVFIVNETLDYLPLQGRQAALSHWLIKLGHGANIVITGNDLYEVARLIHLGQVDLQQANAILYSMGKKSAVRPMDVIGVAMNTGQFALEGVKYNMNKPYEYIITLKRK